MAAIKDTPTSIGLLLLRLGAGGLLLWAHGWPKLAHWQTRMHTFPDPVGLGPVTGFWLVVFSEVACASLVMLGWFTRAACVPPVVFFTIAAFIHHAHDPFPRKELALVFMTAYLCLLFTGAGRFALDARFGPKLSFSGK
jgi:putative oxidoreductase